jgi:hypothetical protein
MSRMKPIAWHDRDRNSRLANVMYPALSDPATQKEMLDISDVEGKRGQMAKRIGEGNRGYGIKAKPEIVVPSKYDNVPGLKRVQADVKAPATKSWWNR